MQPSEVLRLLLDKFPEMHDLAGSADELTLAEPFHAYEMFGAEIRKRLKDQSFISSLRGVSSTS
jgi:hypothetical protein